MIEIRPSSIMTHDARRSSRLQLTTMASRFDRLGVAARSDLDSSEWLSLFAHLERDHAEFTAHAETILGPDYPWPREALYDWSRCWEYPYVLHQARRLDDQRRTARATVVDFGSGATFLPFTIARLGCDVVCVDNDPVCVRGVRRAIGHVDAGRGSARAALSSGADIPVEDQSADLVYSVSTLEHVQEPEQLVPELSRILVPGGTLVLTIDLAYRGTSSSDRNSIIGCAGPSNRASSTSTLSRRHIQQTCCTCPRAPMRRERARATRCGAVFGRWLWTSFSIAHVLLSTPSS